MRDGVATIVDGIPTLAGWLQYLEFVGLLGGLCAAGALVFWLIIKWSGIFETIRLGSAAPAPKRIPFVISVAAAAVIAPAAVAAILSITMDRTCHNMFGDGRTSVGSKMNIDLYIEREDWPKLTALFKQFSASHAMSFRDFSESRPGVVEVLALSACTEEGTVIETNEQRWASRHYGPIFPGWGVLIGVYYVGNGNSWQSVADDFLESLRSEWPGKVRFRDGGGHLVPEPVVPNAYQ